MCQCLHCSYSSGVHIQSCEVQYAKALQGNNSVPVCISQAAQLNGSAVALYNSSTIYDKLLWAATWMYRCSHHCLPLPERLPNLQAFLCQDDPIGPSQSSCLEVS